MNRVPAIIFAIIISLCPLSSFAQSGPKIDLVPIYANQTFENPVSLIIPDDDTNRRFLVEQTGKIKIVPPNEKSSQSEVFMDLNDRMVVEQRFEEGLLGLAFHPEFKTNRKFYLNYTKQGPKRTVVSEFKADATNPNRGDLSSERILMEIQQPDWNHNSGNLFFGPDGLFIYSSRRWRPPSWSVLGGSKQRALEWENIKN